MNDFEKKYFAWYQQPIHRKPIALIHGYVIVRKYTEIIVLRSIFMRSLDISSGGSLMLKAIIWTKADQDLLYYMVSLCQNRLND